MENNIGIITTHFGDNAGAALQAYALQQACNSIPGCVAELVNYQKEGWQKRQAARMHYATGYGPISWLLQSYIKLRRWSFMSFQRKNIIQYPQRKALHRNDLDLLKKRYNQFLIGSDQVWNVESDFFDYTYLLDFVKRSEGVRKGSYAASIGMNALPDDYKKQFRELLSDFDYIGVREKKAVEILEKIVDNPVKWVLDPTFLLDKNDWQRVEKTPEIKDYIFVYYRSKSDNLKKFAERLSKERNLPIIEYGGTKKLIPSAKRMPHPAADVWLGYLMNAECVVTDSFHACAFSVNTNRPFYAFINEGVSSMSSRIYSLLELFSLQSRLVTKDTDLSSLPQIEWLKVNEILSQEREKCRDWLRHSIIG